jgi:hypothetical protein
MVRNTLPFLKAKPAKHLQQQNYIPDRGAEGLWGDKNETEVRDILPGLPTLTASYHQPLCAEDITPEQLLLHGTGENGETY